MRVSKILVGELFLGLMIVCTGMLLSATPALAAGETCANGNPTPCAEDFQINGCTTCHSIRVTGGNRNGTDRVITAATGTTRHIDDPKMADWTAIVEAMIAKGPVLILELTAGYLNTNYCSTCTGPILGSPLPSHVIPSGSTITATITWGTSYNGFEDEPGSTVLYYTQNPSDMFNVGTALTTTGGTYYAFDPSTFNCINTCQTFSDSTPVAHHTATLTGLAEHTRYYIVNETTSAHGTVRSVYAFSFRTPFIQPPPILPPRIYVSENEGSGGPENDRIIVIDPATNTQILPSITVTGKDPGDLVAHPDAITVYAMVGSNLSVIDVLSNSEFVSLMAVGDQFNHLAISPDGSRLYLAYFTVGMGGTLTVKIKVYDTTDSKNPALITTISDPIFDGCSMPLGLGVSPAGNRLYTACRMSDTSLPDNFYMVDTSSNVPTLTATFGRDANITTINAISVKPDGSKVYLARHASGSTANSTVEVFDGSTGASLTSIALADTDNPKAGVFSPDGSLLYVADISNGVHVINTASDTVAATMPKVTSEGFDIGIMPDGSRVYTPLLTKIFVNDTATNTPITTITGDFTNVQNIVVTPGLPGPLGPDLIMTEVMPNAALIVPGGTLSVTDTVKNQGTVSTGGSFLIGYGLSLNTTYGDGDDIPITTTRSVGPVAFGATDTATTSLLIPASTPPGIYHVCANADSTGAVVESNETNNTLCSTATVASAVPDLIMTAVTPNASVVSSAGKLSVSDTVKNLGPVSSGSFKVGYKLSPSGSYDDPGAVASTTTRTVSSLGPSPATNTAPGTILTFPTTIPPGVYFLCAKADSAGVVTELDETNNTLCSASPVTVPAADLLMTAASTTTTVIAPSKTLSLSNTVKNQGGFPAGSFTVAFHLSTDNIYGGGDDVAFTTTRSVTSLAAGGTSAATTSLTIPAATPLGTYYVCVLADSANTVAESNETNNSLCTSTTIQVTRPDLIMTEVTPNAGTVNQGATLSVTNAVQNQGLLTTGVSFRVGFHLSTNTTYGDGDDIAITTTRSVTALAAGASSSVTTSLTIPATTLPGTYYVCAMADSLNGVVETDETNNTLCSSGTVSVPPADLIMSAASTTATTVAAGANFSLSNSVKNQGGSKSGAFVIAFHLSTDNNYGGGDDVVITQTRSITSLAIGATSTASTTLTVPSLTASGTYYVCAMADSNNTVAEGDETNNSRCTTTTINVP